MNTVSKGNRIQRKFKELLLKMGCILDSKPRMRFPQTGKKGDYSLTTDLFGLWDVIAKETNGKTAYFQISTRWKDQDFLKRVRKSECYFSRDWLAMVRYRRGRFELKKYSFITRKFGKKKTIFI